MFIEKEILNRVLCDVDKKTFEECINKGSFQSIYDRHKNYLVNTYFEGSHLRYSVKMAKIFKPIEKDVLHLSILLKKISQLGRKIKLSRKYKGNPELRKPMIIEYNKISSEANILITLMIRFIRKNQIAVK